MPPGTRPLVTQVLRSGGIEFRVLRRMLIVARSITLPNGDEYVLVAQVPRHLAEGRVQPMDLLIRLTVVILTGGILCYWLARYLTTPILRLSDTARRLAAGDMTARVGPRVEGRNDEIADLAGDFDIMADRIQNLLSSERRLLSDISHELRSPLTRLNVALELARQRGGPEMSAYLDRIQRESERMNEMITQLLGLARMENLERTRARTMVDLKQLLEEVVSDVDFEAQSLNRSVRILQAAPCTDSGLPDLLRSAAEYVLRNAVRYTAEETEVEVSLDCSDAGQGRWAVIRVRDHGPGVPPDSLSDLFRPFFRVEDARDRQSGGIGLGLAISERAVAIHGGTISAENAPDGGLVVEMRLPA